MPGEILDCPPCGAELTLAGWSMHTGAWCAVDLSGLLSGLEVRGEGVLVERQDGQVPKRRRFDSTDYSLPMVFSGAVDRDGDPHTDADEGLAVNRRAFRGQVVTAQVIEAQLAYPDGYVEVADAIATRLEWEVKPGALALATLQLTIPRPWQEAA